MFDIVFIDALVTIFICAYENPIEYYKAAQQQMLLIFSHKHVIYE